MRVRRPHQNVSHGDDQDRVDLTHYSNSFAPLEPSKNRWFTNKFCIWFPVVNLHVTVKEEKQKSNSFRKHVTSWLSWNWELTWTTVDGWNPVPVDRQFIPWFTRFYHHPNGGCLGFLPSTVTCISAHPFEAVNTCRLCERPRLQSAARDAA